MPRKSMLTYLLFILYCAMDKSQVSSFFFCQQVLTCLSYLFCFVFCFIINVSFYGYCLIANYNQWQTYFRHRKVLHNMCHDTTCVMTPRLHLLYEVMPQMYKRDPRPPILPLVLAISAVGLKFWVFRFLSMTHKKLTQSKMRP